MKVFVVVYYIQYYSTTIEGVFSTKKLAKQYIKDQNHTDPSNFTGYLVEEWKMDVGIFPKGKRPRIKDFLKEYKEKAEQSS
jgi:hypothetical protein